MTPPRTAVHADVGNQRSRRRIEHTLIYFGTAAFQGIANFATLALLTYLLTPHAFGAYATIAIIVLVGQSCLFYWITGGMLRFKARFDPKQPELLSTAAAGFLGVCLLVALIAVLLSWLSLGDIPDWWVAPVAILIILFAGFDIILHAAIADLDPRRFGVMSLVRSLVLMVVAGGLAWQGAGVHGVLIGMGLSVLVPMLLPKSIRPWLQVRPSKVRLDLMAQLLRYGLPLSASFAINHLSLFSDRLVIGTLLGLPALGLYAAGHDLAYRAIGLAMQVINLSVFPRVVAILEHEGPAAAQRELAIGCAVLCALSLPAVAGLILVSDGVAALMLGPEFRATAAQLIPWIAGAALLDGLRAYYFNYAFQLGTSTRWQVLVASVSTGINVTLNLLLIPSVGLMGAAYASVATLTVSLLLTVWLGRRYGFALPVPWGALARIGAATAVMAGGMLALHTRHDDIAGLALEIAVGVALFGTAGLALDVLGWRSLLFRRLAQVRAQPPATAPEQS